MSFGYPHLDPPELQDHEFTEEELAAQRLSEQKLLHPERKYWDEKPKIAIVQEPRWSKDWTDSDNDPASPLEQDKE